MTKDKLMKLFEKSEWYDQFDDFLNDVIDDDSGEPYIDEEYMCELGKELLQKGYVFAGEEIDYTRDECFVVFSVTKDGLKSYFRIDGYYSSYNGRDMDLSTFYAVEKIPVQAFEWKPKRGN